MSFTAIFPSIGYGRAEHEYMNIHSPPPISELKHVGRQHDDDGQKKSFK
jgi:hypothetical protein